MTFKSGAVGIAKEGTVFKSSLTYLRGGINNSISSDLIDNSELSAGINYMPDHLDAGLLIKRPALSLVSGNGIQTQAFTSIFEGRNANYFSTSSTIKQFGSDVDIAVAALSSTTTPDWTSFDTTDLYVNGSDTPKRIDPGPILTLLGGSPPVFKFIQSYNNRVYGAGHVTDPRVIRFTGLGSGIEDWNALNQFNMRSYDECTGLYAYNNALFYFCRDTFHLLRHGTTDADIGIAYSNFIEGCSSHRSIVGTPYGLFWWSDSGLAVSNQGYSLLDFPVLRLVPQTMKLLNKDRFTAVHGVWHKTLQCVIMFVATGSSATENAAIAYFPPRPKSPESIWFWTGKGVEMGASGFATDNGIYDVYLGSASTDGRLYKQDIDAQDDDGTAIPGEFVTKADSTEYGPDTSKETEVFIPKVVSTGGDGQTIDYSVFIDDQQMPAKTWTLHMEATGGALVGPTLLVPFLVGGPRGNQEFPIGHRFAFKKIRHKFADNASRRTRIRGVTLKGKLVDA